ncbi:MAG: polyhydroxyalkanoate synthesis regulator DNA-binding domain-containing protein [Deltaproteobacteria bacterium]
MAITPFRLGVKMEKAKIIKRYQNRKLYDTDASCYVTLDEIAEMIQQGEEVMVVDNRNQKDITAATLTQIIFEKQKRSESPVPISTLRHIIQQGDGSFSSFLAKSADGNQMEVIRALETQVHELTAKLDTVERKSTVGAPKEAAPVVKTAEV